jgi:hypothetical protein
MAPLGDTDGAGEGGRGGVVPPVVREMLFLFDECA